MPDNPENQFYEVTPESWDIAKKIGSKLRYCVFRGHADKDWHLETTLERAAKKYKCPPRLIWMNESKIVESFKSRAHHFIQSPPEDKEHIEWLSIIQDYGGPTRLLDFSESFYIASFFAVESAEQDACVWAVNKIPLDNYLGENDEFKEFFENKSGAVTASKFANFIFANYTNKHDFVLDIKPPRLNERLAVQKGTFLFPCNIEENFENNLCKMFDFPFESLISYNSIQVDPKALTDDFLSRAYLLKINLPRKWHYDVISDLYSMNIDAASLFPDLGGFAKSLWFHVREMEGKRKRLGDSIMDIEI